MALTAQPKKPVHHRKRQGNHHRRSKRYVKTYFPYLPLLGILGLGLFVSSLWMRPAVLGSTSDFSPQTLLQLTNDKRIDEQQQPLKIDSELQQAAQTKAEDLANENYWAHNSPSGATPYTLINGAGYQYQSAGENLAYGFSDAGGVITGWMNSPEHRQNILDDSYKDVGFGVASAPDYLGKGPATIVVAEYAQPAPAAANISFSVNNPTQSAPAPQVMGSHVELASQRVAKVQLLTGSRYGWSAVAVAAIAGAAACFFLLHNAFKVQRALSRGEAFIARHPWVDFIFVMLATAGYVLTRTGGLIR